jgi:Tfp pilus assembly protein PilF
MMNHRTVAPLEGSIAGVAIPDPSDAEEIRRALDRIIASAAFRDSLRLTSFLKFVVEAALSGKSHLIKSYTIAVEALGRDADFDPQTDPIVRVEARRLRDALGRYYAGPGCDDLFVIDLPLGSYVPTYRRRSSSLGARKFAAVGRRFFDRAVRQRLRLIGFIAVVAAATSASLDVMIVTWHRIGPADVATGVAPAEVGLRVQPFPALAVLPFEAPSGANGTQAALDRLREKLRDAIAVDDDVALVAESSAEAAAAPAQADHSRIDFRISTRVESSDDGTANLTFRLIDEASGTIPWTRTFSRYPVAANDGNAEDTIVRMLVATLFHSSGVVHALERSQRAAGRRIDPRYGCLLDHYELLSAYDSVKRQRVRSCLEQATSTDPNFALGFVSLAEVDIREYTLTDESQGSPQHWLDRALAEALRAAELQPESAHAHLMLMWVRLMRKDVGTALAEGARSLTLDPYDMLIMSDFGTVLIMTGQVEKGYALLRQAAAVAVERPMRMNFGLFCGAYLTGDFAAASTYATAILPESHPAGLFARALAAANSGDAKLARQTLERLYASHRTWAANPSREIQKLFASQDIVDRFSADLAEIAPSGAILSTPPAAPID